MEKNIVVLDMSQMKIWRMRIASCIPKVTNTNSVYVHYNTTTTVTRTGLIVTLYVQYIACPVLLYLVHSCRHNANVSLEFLYSMRNSYLFVCSLLLCTKYVHLTHNSGRVTHICVFTLQLCRTGEADLRF